MTLVIGIATPKGVVLGADGLATLGGIQAPTVKLFPIGSCFAVGCADAAHLGMLLAQALQGSPLSQATPNHFTIQAATTLARDVITATITEYVKHIAFNAQRPLPEQIGATQLLLVGACSDGPLIVVLDQTGNFYPPATPNHSAIGSGAIPALLLLQAYSKYNYAQHPLETSILLTKRILDMVSATVPGIGGKISIITISFTPGEEGKWLAEIDVNSPMVQAGMETWELLEEEMFANLAGRFVGPQPGAEVPPAGPQPDALIEEPAPQAPKPLA